MFERFTDRARQVVVLAQEEARALDHDYIGTEHLLVGILRVEQGAGARALHPLGVTADGVRSRIGAIIGRGDAPGAGQIPFTPRAKKVLELALREAIRIENDYIGTEHILLGITRERDSVAMRILVDLDTNAEAIRDAVFELLGRPDERVGRGRRWRRPASAYSASPGPLSAWEYRVEERDGIDAAWLDELGAECWELVSVVPGEGRLTVIFKRLRLPGSLREAG